MNNKIPIVFSHTELKKACTLTHEGYILSMDVIDHNDKPTFRIITTNESFQIGLVNSHCVKFVNLILMQIGTSFTNKVEFIDFRQYMELIQNIFDEYMRRSKHCQVLNFDNTSLNNTLGEMNMSAADLARKAGIGKSTVYNLTNRITAHPTVKTLSAIQKAFNEKGH